MPREPQIYLSYRQEQRPDGQVITTHRWVSETRDGPREEIGPIAESYIYFLARRRLKNRIWRLFNRTTWPIKKRIIGKFSREVKSDAA